jgi:DNA mismatch repair ATPase MutS
VAQRAGVPASVLERAREVLAELEKHHLETAERPGAKIRKPKIVQASLFAKTDDPVLQALRELNVEAPAEEVVAQVRRLQREIQKS